MKTFLQCDKLLVYVLVLLARIKHRIIRYGVICLERQDFLLTYNIDEKDLAAADISCEELMEIARAYRSMEGLLYDIGKNFIDEYLYDIQTAGIHSYRYRNKSLPHLLEKIVRKRKENPQKFAHLDHTNFHKYMTDLIGIRVLFLYREDWVHFHRYITSQFENNPENYVVDRLLDFDEDPNHYYIAEKPKAYKRGGDTKIYDGNEIDIITDGIYRSLHYIIKYKGQYVEIQGRTLFEEGWSEIDHDIVYPYYKDDEMLQDYSKLLNRLSGLADEMSSYFRKIRELKED